MFFKVIFLSFLVSITNRVTMSDMIFCFSSTVASYKLPEKVVSSIAISGEGLAGLCLGEGGCHHFCVQDKKDSRISFNNEGWKEFLTGKCLRAGQVVLITVCNTTHNNLETMIVIDII